MMNFECDYHQDSKMASILLADYCDCTVTRRCSRGKFFPENRWCNQASRAPQKKVPFGFIGKECTSFRRPAKGLRPQLICRILAAAGVAVPLVSQDEHVRWNLSFGSTFGERWL